SLFIEHINAKKVSSIKLTSNKLYEWQRRYKRVGLDALVDERKSHKRLNLEKLGLKEHAIELIHAQKGSIDITNIYRLLNYEAIKRGVFTLLDFQGKKDEIISYEVVNRFVRGYLKENRLLKEIILYGEDGAISRNLPALGRSNWAVSSINQIVEIDASPLDLICNASDICEEIGFPAVSDVFKDKEEFLSYVKELQRRYTIIALIISITLLLSSIMLKAIENLHRTLELKVAQKTKELQELNTNLRQCIACEVQENRKKDQIMYQQARLASMGETIQNIAHQWRQPLNALTMLIQGVQKQF
ncbi:MAG: hypothetical protein ACTTH5_06710, partial [Wolinella sp.]